MAEEKLIRNSILTIWEERVEIGNNVYLKLDTITYLEGKITKISFKKGYAVLENVAGLTYIPLEDPQYIQILCTHKKYCDDNHQAPKFIHGDANYNIWANIKVGENVFVAVTGEPFVAKVHEINLNGYYAGLLTQSGVTYVPLNLLTPVRVSCK